MSSIYYPESWMQHPEVLRLQQRVRELEQENEFLKEMYDRVINQGVSLCKQLDWARRKNTEMFDKITEFNSLSTIRKMCYHFKLDKE